MSARASRLSPASPQRAPPAARAAQRPAGPPRLGVWRLGVWRLGVLLLGAWVGGCGASPSCPEGQVRQEVCLACGPAGGCAQREERCAPACATMSDCAQGQVCSEGVCQVGGCL
jgi:hypothetical protein